MPKTAKRSSTSSSSVSRKRAAADSALHHDIEDLPRKIRHLGTLIQHVQSFDFQVDEENSPEAKLLDKTIDDLQKQFRRLQDLAFATPLKPGDMALLRARAEVAQYWYAHEIAHYIPGDNSEVGMLGGLISGIFSYCEVDKSIAHADS